MRTITPQQAQKIINIACVGWKKTLAGKWASHIVLKQDVTITDAFYRQMRGACIPYQHELFDEIFGKDVKVKAGDWVTIIRNCFPTGNTFQVTQEMIDRKSGNNDAYDFRHPTYGLYQMDTQARLATKEEIKLSVVSYNIFQYL
jgi:hypothetical protein